MTLINDSSTVTYNGNGVTTSFPYNFIIPDEDDARVGIFTIATGVLTTLTPGDYSINGIGNPAGGEVDYPLAGPALTSDYRIVIWREVPYTQETDLTDQTPYYPTVLEDQLDRIVMQIQQLVGQMDRAIKVTLGSNLTPDQFVTALQAGAAIAQAAATAAAASAVLASQWAQNPEDDAVVPGKYSALHWAMKSQEFAGLIDLPMAPSALDFIRRNADNTAYEARTPAQVAADISTVRYDADQGLTTAQQTQGQENIGALGWKKDAKSADYTVVAADNGGVITVDASGAARTISLPAAATAGVGFKLIIKKVDASANTVTIDPNAAETIDGAATKVLRLAQQHIAIFCDGTAWFVFGEGAIFENGSNANGEYTRFADGTQICTRLNTLTPGGTTWVNSGPRSWPVAFSANPQTYVSLGLPQSNQIISVAIAPTSPSTFTVYVVSQSAAASHDVRALGIGRWF